MSRIRKITTAFLTPILVIGSFAQCAFIGCKQKTPVANEKPQVLWQERIVAADLTADAFTKLIAEAIEETPDCKATTIEGPLKLTAALANGEAALNLESIWSECQGEGEAKLRVNVVERYLAGVKHTFARLASNAPPDVEQIVPLVKSRAWLTHAAEQGINAYQETLVGDLIVVYAEDGPEQLRYVSKDECEAIGISQEDMRALAISNLKSRLPDVQRHGEGPLYMLTVGGTFESSLLLFSSLWESLEDVVDGRVVVATPSRDLVMVTGENASEAVQEMRELADRNYQDGNYSISNRLLIRENGRWIRWPAGDSVPKLNAEQTENPNSQ